VAAEAEGDAAVLAAGRCQRVIVASLRGSAV